MERLHNCKHYIKNCSRFVFECCQSIDSCHRCHKEKHNCKNKPLIVLLIQCNLCHQSQIPSNKCINIDCNTIFAENFCNICYIWTRDDITHCNECGLCRIGVQGSLYHCSTCDCCYNINYSQSHTCSKTKISENDCPVCLESLHSSRENTCVTSCRHPIHVNCLKLAFNAGIFTCVICRELLD